MDWIRINTILLRWSSLWVMIYIGGNMGDRTFPRWCKLRTYASGNYSNREGWVNWELKIENWKLRITWELRRENWKLKIFFILNSQFSILNSQFNLKFHDFSWQLFLISNLNVDNFFWLNNLFLSILHCSFETEVWLFWGDQAYQG